MRRITRGLVLLVGVLTSDRVVTARIIAGGVDGDEQTSIVYDAQTGELAVDAPLSAELFAISIRSVDGIFSSGLPHCFGESCEDLDGQTLFRSSFTATFGDFSWGDIADPKLSEQFLLTDLAVTGLLGNGSNLGQVDLVYRSVPEPTGFQVGAVGSTLVVLFGFRWIGLRRAVA